jgi:hypothetical protein
MFWEGHQGTEDGTGEGGNRDGRQPADSRSVAGLRRGPDRHRVAPADPPPGPAGPVTSDGARALHINHTRPARIRHSGRLRWLTWPAAGPRSRWVSAGEERAHGTAHGRAQRIPAGPRTSCAKPASGTRSGRRTRSPGLNRLCGGRLKPRGPGLRGVDGGPQGRLPRGRARAPRPVRLKYLYPERSVARRAGPAGRRRWPRRPGFAMMVS